MTPHSRFWWPKASTLLARSNAGIAVSNSLRACVSDRAVLCSPFLCGLKMAVFWDVSPRSLLEVYRRFRDAYYLYLHGLIMEAASVSETSITSTRLHSATTQKTAIFIKRFNTCSSYIYIKISTQYCVQHSDCNT
jgi:hypothetical protein